MPKQIRPPLEYYSYDSDFDQMTIEHSPSISQDQLSNARIYSSREEYAKALPKGIRYLEIGVAWGYSAKMFIDASQATSADLLDLYDQDLKCWSWRKFGECKCQGKKHELLYTPDTHEEYIKQLFLDYTNINTIKGNAADIVPNMTSEYDFIYIDISNDRILTREVLKHCKAITPVNGIIGLNDYVIYDGVIEDQPYGTFQTVNEFLDINKNWSVDAIALHPLGFYDIYIRRNY